MGRNASRRVGEAEVGGVFLPTVRSVFDIPRDVGRERGRGMGEARVEVGHMDLRGATEHSRRWGLVR